MRRLWSVLVIAMAAPAWGQTPWEIDPAHTSVQFGVRHDGSSVCGGSAARVPVRADDQDTTRSVIEVTLDAASIDTREPKRDEHLRSPDFLDVARFPAVTFRSKRIEKAGEGRYRVIGDLALHGVTREVVLDVEGPTAPVKDMMGLTRAGAHATAKIDRRDFGVAWSKVLEGGGLVVGNEVAITIDVEAIRK
jgi:polyisoprenoid-binding protein YceI